MGKGTEIELKNLGSKTGIKLIADDDGKVVIATEANVPLQPVKPDGKLDETAVHDDQAGEFSPLTEKGSPAPTDLVMIEDSEDGLTKKKVQVGNIGGGGSSSFLGLTDTPNAYDGAQAKLVAVKDIVTPDGLEFIDPATLPVASHDHSVADLTDFDPADYMPFIGGIMTGNIDFQDDGEGIRFWDQDAAFFNGLKFDSAEGAVIVGGNAPGLGGPPPVRAHAGIFQLGYSGLGFASFWVWHEGAGDFVPFIEASSDNPGDPMLIGTGEHALGFQGTETRPQYNFADLALLSDVGGGGGLSGAEVPRYGTGTFHASVLNGIAVILNPDEGGGAARVSARDLVATVRGGGTLTYQIDSSMMGGPGPSIASTDPTAALLDYLPAHVGTMVVMVSITDSDSGNTHMYETYILIQDPWGLGGP